MESKTQKTLRYIALVPWAAALLYGLLCAICGYDYYFFMSPRVEYGPAGFIFGALALIVGLFPVYIASAVYLIIRLVKHFLNNKRERYS